MYTSLLLKWNKAISLTTVTDPVKILEFHFGESLFAVSAAALKNGRLADVGSGAGFPGLPLAMALSDLRVTLIEANLKKCAFLAEVVRTLDLKNVEILRERMEDVSAKVSPFDFISARALGQHEELLDWANVHLSSNGRVILWLGEADAEFISGKIGWKWQKPALIPGSHGRFILSGCPEP